MDLAALFTALQENAATAVAAAQEIAAQANPPLNTADAQAAILQLWAVLVAAAAHQAIDPVNATQPAARRRSSSN